MVFPTQPQRGMQQKQIFPNRRLRSETVTNSNSKQNRGWQPLVAKGVDGVSKTLTNVQQVLNVVQSTTPIIQQYGPMVKNIPSMYRMLKAFKDVESSDSPEEAKTAIKPDKQNSASTKQTDIKQDVLPKQHANKGQSTPKLFI